MFISSDHYNINVKTLLGATAVCFKGHPQGFRQQPIIGVQICTHRPIRYGKVAQAWFVSYLKVIITYKKKQNKTKQKNKNKKNHVSYSKLSEKLKNYIEILVGRVIL